jgi:tetratricopeptide (TPR) repeat protein
VFSEGSGGAPAGGDKMSSFPDQSRVDSRFREALALHQQSRLVEASSAYREVIGWQPRHVQALTYLGVIAFQEREFERALEWTARALEVDPHSAATHLMRGHALMQLGRSEEAIESYDCVIALKPDSADAYLHRGNALTQAGKNLAAVSSYDGALALRPNSAEIHNNRGNALRSLREFEAAIKSYERAIAAMPGLAEPYFNRGLALHELKHHEAALASYDQAIAMNPGFAEAYFSRGNTQRDIKQLGEALTSYDRAIAAKVDYAEAHCNRGNLLCELERLEAALSSYDSAIAVAADYADAHCNRGILLGELGRYEEALQSFERAVAIDPHHASAHVSRAFVRLMLGDLENGWRDFEWRWKNERSVTIREKRDFSQPLWFGDESLEGKTILLHCEQGLGDTIQFCRYAPLIVERGASVIFEVPESLHQLLRSLKGVTRWVVQGEPLPPFDFYCPLMSLPMACGTTLETVPSSIPYLRADAERRQHWRHKLGERVKPRVGLVWSGGFRPNLPELWAANDRRNIPLRKLAALRHPGIEFYSLQKGQPAEEELARLVEEGWDGPNLKDHTDELHDFEDTAALIEQLDLVISVDTSTAHLAGALGKPVWIMNRLGGDWRWLLDRTDSPWYPTARLYRQRRRGDWEGVVRNMRHDLEQWVGADGAAPLAEIRGERT